MARFSQVIDESDSPIPNATVQIGRDRDTRRVWTILRSSDGAVVTGSNGEFEFEGLTQDAFTIVAKRAGAGAGHTSGIRTGENATVVLHALGSIAGKVDVRGGRAPEDFRIELGGDAAPYGIARFVSFAHTEGRFQIDDLIAGDYTLTVVCAAGTGTVEARVESGKQTAGLIIPIEGRTTVRGRLIDLDSGRPAGGVMVSGEGASGSSKSGTSKGDGTFEIDEAPAGKVEVAAPPRWEDAGGYVEMFVGVKAELQPIAFNDLPPIYVRRNPLRAGERRGYFGINIELARGGGFVLGAVPGSPAARAGIRAGDEITHIDGADITGSNGYQFWLRVVARAGQEMEFRLRDGRVLRLTAEAPQRPAD